MKSMTGYGRAKGVYNGTEITAEIKSVNNRYLETNIKLPRTYIFLEDAVKKAVQSEVARGKADVFLSFQRIEGSDKKVSVDTALASQYLDALKKSGEDLGLRNDLSLSTLFRIPEVFTVLSEEEDEEGLTEAVTGIVKEALRNFNAMRKTEGEKLKSDILPRLDYIGELSEKIETDNLKTAEAYRERLYERLREVLGDRSIDEARVLQEAAIFADKVSVNEEAVRLRSHISQFKAIMESDGAVGKKLDFLTQELNREANTAGSKCQDSEVTKSVIELKSEIEKIREQIQNIE